MNDGPSDAEAHFQALDEQTPPPSYFVECLQCDWARCYRGDGGIPTVPHALHFVETGHDKIRSGNVVPHNTQEFTPAEWSDAIMFSAGVQYGNIYAARAIRAAVVKALPDEAHVAPGRERDVHTLEQVEAYKRSLTG